MQEYRLDRTGEPPLVFSGEQVAEEAGKWVAGRDRNRWIDLRVYRTAAGTLILERVYRTLWQGEEDQEEAVACASTEALAEVLRAWDPSDLAIGFPAGEQFEERQAKLLGDLRQLYRTRAGKILGDLDVVERVD